MFIKQFNTKSEFDNYIQGNAKIGRYFIISDENNNNDPTEYYYDGIDVNFIGGNENYKIVDTIEDRDNISIDNLNDGILVYVINEKIEYKLENGQWLINDITYNRSTTIEQKIYYIDNTGSDETGDGTILNPWKTLRKCISTIPSQLKDRITIQLGTGDYHFDTVTRFILSEFLLNGQLIIKGTMSLVRDGFTTLSTRPDVNNIFRKNVNITFDYENQYYGYCLNGITPCGKHGINDLTGTNLYTGNATSIYSYDSKLIFDEERLPKIMNGSQNFRLQNLKINFPGTQNIVNFQSFITHQWWNVVVDEIGNRRIRLNGDFLLIDVLVKSNVTSSMCLEIISPNTIAINDTMIYGIGSGKAIEIVRSNIDLGSILIDGFDSSFVSQFNVIVGHYTTSPTVLYNINKLFNIGNSGFKLNTNPTTLYYIDNIDYYINDISENININIDLRNIIQNNKTPNIDYFVNRPLKLVDPSKNFSIQYDGSETFESEYIHYRIVNDITERDNILNNEKTEGMLVYTISGDTEYRWIDNEWSINSTNSGLSDSYWNGVTGTDDIYYNNGKVGINKYPDELLDVNGNINIVSGSTYMIDNQIALRIVNNNNLYSVHVGFDTGSDDITESETAIGYYSLKRNVGKFSVGLGSFAGNDNVGNYSTMIGSSAGSANSGITITSIGFESGYNNTGDYLTSIGGHSGSLNIGDYCTFIGAYSGIENIANNVVAIGYESASGNTLDNQFIVQQRNININPLIQGDFLNGNVGINTPVATATLDINGNIRIRTGGILTTGNVLTLSNEDGTAIWSSPTGSGGTPSGPEGSIQFNSSDTLVGVNDLKWDNGNKTLNVIGDIHISSGNTYKQDGLDLIKIRKTGNLKKRYSINIGPSGSNLPDSIDNTEISIGQHALSGATGIINMAFGTLAGRNTTGSRSIFIGEFSGSDNTGENVVIIGNVSGGENQGDNVLLLGPGSGHNNTGNNVIAIGSDSGSYNVLDNQFIIHQKNINDTPLIQGDLLTGKVGINMSGATTTLDINGDTNIRGVNDSGNINYLYLGGVDIDNSWRFTVDSSNNLIIQRRISGNWVTKETISG